MYQFGTRSSASRCRHRRPVNDGAVQWADSACSGLVKLLRCIETPRRDPGPSYGGTGPSERSGVSNRAVWQRVWAPHISFPHLLVSEMQVFGIWVLFNVFLHGPSMHHNFWVRSISEPTPAAQSAITDVI
ncbi:unnamed protein product [Durusdinium trenchii]|uniref:Uncharacterized protein n=1 Tax=Durusdinium trenchii TaxID=1381693 RepID=A0ABP0K517_9DINO